MPLPGPSIYTPSHSGWADHLILCPLISPIPDAGKGEGEEDEEKDGTRLGLSTTPRNCIPRRGISVLEKLVKTCPVWLQLGLGQAEAAKILQQEMAGVSQFCAPREAGTAVRDSECSPQKCLHANSCCLSALLFAFCICLFLCHSQQWGGWGQGVLAGSPGAFRHQRYRIVLAFSDFGS